MPLHYLELSGAGQTHINKPLENFVEAIRFITGKGGWVIKLGGRNFTEVAKHGSYR